MFFIVAFSFGQEHDFLLLQKSIEGKQVDSADVYLKKISNKNLNVYQKAKLNYLKAVLFRIKNQDNLAFDFYLRAKKQFNALDSVSKVAQINIELVSMLLAIEKNTIDYNLYLNEFIDYARKTNNPKFFSQSYMQLGKAFYDQNPQLAIRYFKQAYQENQKTNDEVYGARILQNIGATYASDKILKLDSALYVYEKALKIYKKHKEFELESYIYINKGVVFTKQKKYEEAIQSFLKADAIPVKEFENKNKETLYGFLATAYKEKGDFKKALEYIEKQKVYQDILSEGEQKKAIKEIDVRYKTKEKELENISLKEKLTKNKLAFQFALVALILVIVTAFLSFKNILRKKKIIEQDRKIALAEFEKKLKENELREIDKMLEGQEKERQKIADELHDHLGSLLATLKMNFQVLKDKNPLEPIMEKSEKLLDETYNEVRNISHLKNVGMIGKEGLLIAVQEMAEKMSAVNKIKFHVIPFGLEGRLESAVELLLFRSIQELCSNILKHAQATEVNIYLTQHDASEINIIIEDNGVGFDPQILKQNKGIGLKNLERKIEQMHGTVSIDSQVSGGTTIIIDLPL